MKDQRGGPAARSAEWIASTRANASDVALGRPAIIHYNEESRARGVEKLLTTITVCNKHALIKATVIDLYGRSGAADMEALLPTLSGKDWHSLACLVIVRVKHGHRELGSKSNNRRPTPMNQCLPALATTPAGCWTTPPSRRSTPPMIGPPLPNHSSCRTSARPRDMIHGPTAPTNRRA